MKFSDREGGLQPQRAPLTWKWRVGKEAASALGRIFTQRRKITSVLHHPAACHNHKGLFTHWSDSEPSPGLRWQSINSQVSPTQPGHWLNPLRFLQVVKEGLNFWLHHRKSISRLALSYDFSHTLSREDLRKSRDSMTHLFLSALFSFDSTEQGGKKKMTQVRDIFVP